MPDQETRLIFAVCPACGDHQVVKVVKDWQKLVNHPTNPRQMPIIGRRGTCGNPWHYVKASAKLT